MKFEGLNNLSRLIETEDKQEQQTVLFERITKISLVYAEQNFQATKKNKRDYKFSAAMKDFSPIENIILRPVFHLEQFNFNKYQPQIDLFLQAFYQEVDYLYETSGFDVDKISQLIDAKRDNIKKYLEVEDLKEAERNARKGSTKVLNFNKITSIERDADKKYQDLEKYGFSKADHFVEVHVEDFYNTGEKNLGSELISSDLGVVAEYILDKEPEAAAVIGKSWLLDTPLADRLGFKKIADNNIKQNDFSTWLQFIDKNGQIDHKRFKALLKTGELPYQSIKGYILTEEFLSRYLPAHRRGVVMLKELNKDREVFWNQLQQEAQSIKTDWDDLLKNHGDIEGFLNSNKTLNKLFDLIAPGDKQVYFNFLKVMYNSNIPWAEFFEHKSEQIEEIDAKINKVMQDDLYMDKEVVIE